jgi:hypothetical protein
VFELEQMGRTCNLNSEASQHYSRTLVNRFRSPFVLASFVAAVQDGFQTRVSADVINVPMRPRCCSCVMVNSCRSHQDRTRCHLLIGTRQDRSRTAPICPANHPLAQEHQDDVPAAQIMVQFCDDRWRCW